MNHALVLGLAIATASCALVDSRNKEPGAAVRAPLAAEPAKPASNAELASAGGEDTAATGLFGLSRSGLWARWNAVRGDAYELDAHERFLEAGSSRPVCDPTGLVNYAGKTVRYQGPVRINEHFLPRLERFEAIVAEVAEEVYGRAPRRIRHYGAYSCRTSRNRTHRLSEHALGNAIDVVGFDFAPLPKGETLDPALPKSLRHAFQVRVAKHWENQKTPANEVHARFLRSLLDRLLARDDVFRGVIGPGHRGHSDHFHFDMSPWRFVRL